MRSTPRPRRRGISSTRRKPITSSRRKTTSPPSRPTSRPSGGTLFPPQHTETTKGHGRIETRSISTSSELAGYLTFPYAAQVFRLERCTTDAHGRTRRTEIAYGLSSLGPAQADPARLLALNRGHWEIETGSTVRDATFDEDRCRIRKGAGARVMTFLCNFVISLLRLAGARYIPPGLRACAGNPTRTLRLIGVVLA
jgi:hypothetical protein